MSHPKTIQSMAFVYLSTFTDLPDTIHVDKFVAIKKSFNFVILILGSLDFRAKSACMECVSVEFGQNTLSGKMSKITERISDRLLSEYLRNLKIEIHFQFTKLSHLSLLLTFINKLANTNCPNCVSFSTWKSLDCQDSWIASVCKKLIGLISVAQVSIWSVHQGETAKNGSCFMPAETTFCLTCSDHWLVACFVVLAVRRQQQLQWRQFQESCKLLASFFV